MDEGNRRNHDDCIVCSPIGRWKVVTHWQRDYRAKGRFDRVCEQLHLDMLNLKYV